MRSSLCFLSLAALASCENQRKSIVFTFVVINGTLTPVAKNIGNNGGTDDDEAAITKEVLQAILLGIIVITGFVASAVLITTVLSSITLRKFPFYILLMNVGVICLIECSLNIIVSLVYVVGVHPWKPSKWICYENAFIMEVLPTAYTFILMGLTVDRAVALRDPIMYRKNLRTLWHHVLIGFLLTSWLAAILSPAVIAGGVLQSWPFPDRLSCQVMDEDSHIYAIITLVLVYALPLLVTSVAMVLIQRFVASEKRKERKEMRGQHAKFSTHTAAFFANAHLWNELRNVMLVVALLVLYMACILPYAIRIRIDQIKKPHDLEHYNYLAEPYFEEVAANDTSKDVDVGEDVTRVRVVPEELPEVFHDSLNGDEVFVWLRYVQAVLAPILVLTLQKDLRKKCKDLVSCWRPNSVENGSPRPVSDYIRKKRRELEEQKKRFKNVTSYTVPVLFATSDGLCLRTVDESFSGTTRGKVATGNKLANSVKSQWTVEPEFVTEFCDLQIHNSHANTNNINSSNSNRRNSFGSTVHLVKAPNAVSQEHGRQEFEGDEGKLLDSPNRKVQFNSKIEEIPVLDDVDDEVKEKENDAQDLRLRKKKRTSKAASKSRKKSRERLELKSRR